ncbi:hypothetical protein Q4R05_08975, partial [Morganella morganii subsp. sibonii]
DISTVKRLGSIIIRDKYGFKTEIIRNFRVNYLWIFQLNFKLNITKLPVTISAAIYRNIRSHITARGDGQRVFGTVKPGDFIGFTTAACPGSGTLF